MKIKKAYFSYWSGGYFNWKKTNFSLENKIDNKKLKDKFVENTLILAVSRAKQHFSEVHMITDEESADIFKKFNFDSVTTGLEKIPKDYTAVWSISKLYAYKLICLKGDPFIHIDNDVFLWKNIPDDIINAPIFAQSRELVNLFGYRLEDFYKNCPKKYLASKVPKLKFAPNVGIVGGHDLAFFYNYASSGLNMILDPINKKYWTSHKGLVSWRKAVIGEQYYLGIAAKYYNKDIKYYFNNDEDFYKVAMRGYTHLMGAKYGLFMKDKISFLADKLNFLV